MRVQRSVLQLSPCHQRTTRMNRKEGESAGGRREDGGGRRERRGEEGDEERGGRKD